MSSLFAFKKPAPPSSCVLLGRVYGGDEEGWEEMRDEVRKLLWFTYRKNMPGEFDSDRGWGCTIRSTQMLFGNALWRVAQSAAARERGGEADSRSNTAIDSAAHNIKARIAQLFIDWPLETAKFSIQRFVKASGYSPGRWYAPHESSHIVAKLAKCDACVSAKNTETSPHMVAHLPDSEEGGAAVSMNVLICPDSCVAMDEVLSSAKNGTKQPENSTKSCKNSENGGWTPTLVLIPLRLGIEGVQAELGSQLLNIIRLPAFAGAVGGSPRHSVFFVGVAGTQLMCLDPHTTQACPPPPSPTAGSMRSASADSAAMLTAASMRSASADSAAMPTPHADADVVALSLEACVCQVKDTVGGSRAVTVSVPSTKSVPESSISSFVASLEAPAASAPALMPLSRIDPTITLGFLFESEEDFTNWSSQAMAVCAKASGSEAPSSARLVDIAASRPDFSYDGPADDCFADMDGEDFAGAEDTHAEDHIEDTLRDNGVKLRQHPPALPPVSADATLGSQVPDTAECGSARSRGMSFALIDEVPLNLTSPHFNSKTALAHLAMRSPAPLGAASAHASSTRTPSSQCSPRSCRSSQSSFSNVTAPGTPTLGAMAAPSGIALLADRQGGHKASPNLTGLPANTGGTPYEHAILPPRVRHGRSSSFAEVIWNGKTTASPLFVAAHLDPATPMPLLQDDLSLSGDNTNNANNAKAPKVESSAPSRCSFRDDAASKLDSQAAASPSLSIFRPAWEGLTAMFAEQCSKFVGSPPRQKEMAPNRDHTDRAAHRSHRNSTTEKMEWQLVGSVTAGTES